MPKPLRSLLNLLLRVTLLLVIAVELVYLLRRPLLERPLLARASAELSKLLDAEVSIGALGGNWLTAVQIDDLRVRSRGPLRELDIATLQVCLDPLALARGDLSGLQRVHVRARSVQLDLGAESGATAAPKQATAPPDLAALAALCRDGAQVEIAAFTLRGAQTIAGTLAIALAPGAGTPRRISAEGCGVRVSADLLEDGTLHAVACADQPLRAAHLFADLPWLHSGRVRTHASLRLAPAFHLLATARGGGFTVDGHPVETLAAHGHIDSDGLHDFDVDVTTPGGAALVRGFALPFGDALALSAQWLRAEVADFTPHAHLLPEAVPRPLRGTLAAHIDRGTAHLHAGQASIPPGRATLRAGAIDLASGHTRAPLRAALVADLGSLAPAAPVPLGEARSQVALELTDAGAALRGEFALAPVPGDAAAGEAQGNFDLVLGTQPQASLRLARARALVLGHQLTLAGNVDWRNDQLTARELELHDGYGNRVELSGSVGLGADLDWRTALAERADLRARLAGVDLAPWLATALPAAAAALRGEVTWRTRGAVALRATLDASVSDIAVGGELLDARAALDVTADGTRAEVRSGRLDVGPARLTVAGALDASPVAWLRDSARVLEAALALRATLDDLPLATLPHSGLGIAELGGRARGALDLRGTLAAPQVTGDLELAEVDLRTHAGERIDDLSGRLEFTPNAARLLDVRASRGTGPLQLAGELRADGPLWSRWADAKLELSLTGQDVLLHRRAGLKVRADLDLAARGTPRDFALTGSVAVRNSKFVSRLPLFDLRRTGGEAASSGIDIPGVALPAPLRGRLDVAIATAQPFAVETNLLTGKFDAQLQLRGDLAAPGLLGTVSGPDATLVLPGARLRTSALLLEFRADAPRFPQLTANARGRRHGFDILVTAQGRYDRPDIVFSSEPALPPDELLVLVTTGARPDALRNVRGVGTVLGAYVAQEFADWIFGSDSTEAKETFLDRFTVETGTEISRGGSESIVVEFRLSDRLYLQGERDVYSDINMGLVYRLRFR